MEATKSITKIISFGHELSIGRLNGETIISLAKDIFKAGIDSEFKIFGLDMPSRPTKRIDIVVREVISDVTFLRIFKSIDQDLNKSVLTMSQIIEFCAQHPDWLCQDGLGTSFLTKKRINVFKRILSWIMKIIFGKKSTEKYFVVYVDVYSVGLHVDVFRLEDVDDWIGGCHLRVVSPQLVS